MQDVTNRRKDKKLTESEDDYGFYYPFQTVRGIYWERENAERTNYPDEGGMLDQDEHLMQDLQTFGWVRSFAENRLDKDEALADALKGQRHA